MQQAKIMAQTIGDQVYYILKQQIIDGVYREGEKIVEQSVADELKVSRSPVREAINRLIVEGLLDSKPNRGAFVKKYNSKNISDIFAARKMMEEFAVANAKDVLREKYMQEMLDLKGRIDNITRENHLELDRDIHRILLKLCGNEVLFDMYKQLYTQISVVQEVSQMDEMTFLRANDAHRVLLNYLINGDYINALWVVSKHLEEGETRAKEYFIHLK